MQTRRRNPNARVFTSPERAAAKKITGWPQPPRPAPRPR
jgi:hypothetical protein